MSMEWLQSVMQPMTCSSGTDGEEHRFFERVSHKENSVERLSSLLAELAEYQQR